MISAGDSSSGIGAAYRREVCGCLPLFCKAVDKNGNNNGVAELSDAPRDAASLNQLLSANRISYADYARCTSFTQNQPRLTRTERTVAGGMAGAAAGLVAVRAVVSPLIESGMRLAQSSPQAGPAAMAAAIAASIEMQPLFTACLIVAAGLVVVGAALGGAAGYTL